MRNRHFDFIGQTRRYMLVSGVAVLISLAALAILGLNLSIDFVGGSSFVLEGVQADVDGADLRDAAQEAGAADVTAQTRLEDGVATGAIVRTEAVEPGSEEEQAIAEALREVTDATDVTINFVGPSWGERISQKAVQALIVFLIVVFAYITLRLELKMAGSAIVALVHDVAITVGVYALFGFTVSPSTVIALLTILGYSLYDSVIVFDRIKENGPQLGELGHRTYSESVNTSLNQVLWRSINTSLTSLLPVGSLLFIGSRLLGAETLQDLALALFIGMFLGTYSSIFVAGPVLSWWKEREPENQKLAQRASIKAEQAAAKGEDGKVATDPTEKPVAPPSDSTPITTDYVRGRGKRKRRR